MPSKNDLSALKTTKQQPILPPREKPRAQPEAIRAANTQGRVGRPKKAATEKRSYKITLSLTQAEGERIAEKAGLAGEATYLYDIMKQHGIIE